MTTTSVMVQEGYVGWHKQLCVANLVAKAAEMAVKTALSEKDSSVEEKSEEERRFDATAKTTPVKFPLTGWPVLWIEINRDDAHSQGFWVPLDPIPWSGMSDVSISDPQDRYHGFVIRTTHGLWLDDNFVKENGTPCKMGLGKFHADKAAHHLGLMVHEVDPSSPAQKAITENEGYWEYLSRINKVLGNLEGLYESYLSQKK